jgi:hypothetical protein
MFEEDSWNGLESRSVMDKKVLWVDHIQIESRNACFVGISFPLLRFGTNPNEDVFESLLPLLQPYMVNDIFNLFCFSGLLFFKQVTFHPSRM